jgi:hypothetical protein
MGEVSFSVKTDLIMEHQHGKGEREREREREPKGVRS